MIEAESRGASHMLNTSEDEGVQWGGSCVQWKRGGTKVMWIQSLTQFEKAENSKSDDVIYYCYISS